MKKCFLWGCLLCLAAAGCSPPATARANTDVALTQVLDAPGVIWSFAFLSPTQALATLRQGKLLHADLANNSWQEVALPLDIADSGQGGLMDVHVHRLNGDGGELAVFLTYSTPRADGSGLTTALARGVWTGEELREVRQIFAATTRGRGGRHFGSRLAFDGDHIFMTVGDRGERDWAQELSAHNGKILRLNLDGSAAAGNPFANTAGALPEIWSFGHRNPQGIDFDAAGQLWSVEFGPRGGDELNLITRGDNYGWPVITYGREYWGPSIGEERHPGMQQPVTHWTPSISPSGMAVYDGDVFDDWRGDIFVACLSGQHLRRVALQDGRVTAQEALFEELDERIRHVRVGPDGHLYFSTDSGKFYKVEPKG